MEITEVRILKKESPDKKLKAYATVTFDNSFTVRNVKVIQGKEALFIAMPSRRLKHPCPKCNARNESKAKFCSQCGASLPLVPQPQLMSGQKASSQHKDIAHPITQEFREYLQKKVLEAYGKEEQPGVSNSEPRIGESV